MNNLLCVAIMVKNEEARIIRTLSTIIDHVCHVIVLDTGSTDKTIELIEAYCKEKKKKLKLDIKEFVDFSYNRNILLRMCYGLSKYVILLDANDEIRNPQTLIDFLKKVKNKKDCLFFCRFIWENCFGVDESKRIYNKPNIIRNNIREIYYKMPVHEYLYTEKPNTHKNNYTLVSTNFHFYQDRSKDKSSEDRWHNDIVILRNYLNKNLSKDLSKDLVKDNVDEILLSDLCHAYKYLCQSYNCILDYDNLHNASKEWYNFFDILKNKFPMDTYFNENYYTCIMCLAFSMCQLKINGYEKYYLEAYEYCKPLFNNIEPLVRLAQAKYDEGKYKEAYEHLKPCITAPIPTNININIEMGFYTKYRWEILNKLMVKLNDK